MLRKWSTTMTKEFKQTSYVCELHFNTDDVIKTDRTVLKDHLQTPDGIIKIVHWNALLKYENYSKANLQMAYKLTPQHIQPEGYQKVNVPLAIELFSESVLNVMKILKDDSDCPELVDCGSTIERVNQLIKAMLSRASVDSLKPGDNNVSKKICFY